MDNPSLMDRLLLPTNLNPEIALDWIDDRPSLELEWDCQGRLSSH